MLYVKLKIIFFIIEGKWNDSLNGSKSYFKTDKCYFQTYKTLIKLSYRTLYSGLGSCVETWKLGCCIESGGYPKKNDKIIK